MFFSRQAANKINEEAHFSLCALDNIIQNAHIFSTRNAQH